MTRIRLEISKEMMSYLQVRNAWLTDILAEAMVSKSDVKPRQGKVKKTSYKSSILRMICRGKMITIGEIKGSFGVHRKSCWLRTQKSCIFKELKSIMVLREDNPF